jgi:hypothetical protein
VLRLAAKPLKAGQAGLVEGVAARQQHLQGAARKQASRAAVRKS